MYGSIDYADLIVTDLLFKEGVCFPAATEVLTAAGRDWSFNLNLRM